MSAFFRSTFGVRPRKAELYHTALVHRSRSEQRGEGSRINNERLEFLGDAVLSSVVAEYLFAKYPEKGEGYLSELRSKIVSRSTLNRVAHEMGLSRLISYDRHQQGVFKSMEGDALEAVIGAIFLDRGYRCAHKAIAERVLPTYVDVDKVAHTEWNYKSKLIDWGQKGRHKVVFSVLNTSYEDESGCRRRVYECGVSVDGQLCASASDFSIKEAEQKAAEQVCLSRGIGSQR